MALRVNSQESPSILMSKTCVLYLVHRPLILRTMFSCLLISHQCWFTWFSSEPFVCIVVKLQTSLAYLYIEQTFTKCTVCVSCFSKSWERRAVNKTARSCPHGTFLPSWDCHCYRGSTANKIENSMLMVISSVEKNKAEKGGRFLAS